MPFPKYSGAWKNKGTALYDLTAFFEFISTLPFINSDQISDAKKGGWFFDTNIPLGYGLGSSGCLCAACYEQFGRVSEDYTEIKKHLSLMESFFHGTSSGLDPLTIYLNKPLQLLSNSIQVITTPIDTGNVFVLDSGIHRNAKTFIAKFRERKESDKAFGVALAKLNQLNEVAIDNLITGMVDFEVLALISQLQWNHFQDMIPEAIKPIWEHGLRTGEYSMKLSGAGGGGCFLVFSENQEFDSSVITYPIITV